MTATVEPIRLPGLKQAVYVMERLASGRTESEVVDDIGDAQLVDMWMSFLLHNHWIEAGTNGWEITKKGAEWSRRRSA